MFPFYLFKEKTRVHLSCQYSEPYRIGMNVPPSVSSFEATIAKTGNKNTANIIIKVGKFTWLWLHKHWDERPTPGSHPSFSSTTTLVTLILTLFLHLGIGESQLIVHNESLVPCRDILLSCNCQNTNIPKKRKFSIMKDDSSNVKEIPVEN